MNKILILLSLLALAGCNTTSQFQPTVTKMTVVVPDQSMYACPLYKRFPNADTLTDVQVAKTIVDLYKNNVKCKNSIESIRKFLNNSKQTVEQDLQQADSNNRFPGPLSIFAH